MFRGIRAAEFYSQAPPWLLCMMSQAVIWTMDPVSWAGQTVIHGRLHLRYKPHIRFGS